MHTDYINVVLFHSQKRKKNPAGLLILEDWGEWRGLTPCLRHLHCLSVSPARLSLCLRVYVYWLRKNRLVSQIMEHCILLSHFLPTILLLSFSFPLLCSYNCLVCRDHFAYCPAGLYQPVNREHCYKMFGGITKGVPRITEKSWVKSIHCTRGKGRIWLIRVSTSLGRQVY